MKLLIDEMLSPDIAVQLRRRGHDAVAIAELPDLRSASDVTIFKTAQAEERAILTENLADFRTIASKAIEVGEHHYGIVLTTNSRFPRKDDRTVGRLVRVLHEILVSNPDCMDREFWLS